MKGVKASLLLLSLLLSLTACTHQEAQLVYSSLPTPTPSPSPKIAEPSASPELLSFPAMEGSSFTMDEKGVPVLDQDTHFYRYYLVFTDLRIYEEDGFSYLDGICHNAYSQPLSGELSVEFYQEQQVFGKCTLHTAQGDMLLQPGENRIYGEILSETDIQTMDFRFVLLSPFLPVGAKNSSKQS